MHFFKLFYSFRNITLGKLWIPSSNNGFFSVAAPIPTCWNTIPWRFIYLQSHCPLEKCFPQHHEQKSRNCDPNWTKLGCGNILYSSPPPCTVSLNLVLYYYFHGIAVCCFEPFDLTALYIQ